MAVDLASVPRALDDPSSVLHRLAAAYIPAGSAVGIFRAHHFPTTPWHLHDFYELAIVESGTAFHLSERGIEPIERGTVLFLPPGVGHEYRLCTDVQVYNCLFRSELAEAELMWAFRDGHLGALFDPARGVRGHAAGPIVRVQLPDTGIERVIDALEPINANSPDARTRAGQVGRLLVALDIVATAAHDPSGRDEPERAVPPAVSTALSLIEEDITHPWTLTELSQRAYVGPTHLARTFAKVMGLPPMHYLSRIRAERAAAMLAKTDDPIATIGVSVGWADPAYFSRRFRSEFGTSPREYRHRHRSAPANSAAAD
jgi:AraC family L-rhamnose operon transcriptional activator RhaR